MRALGTVRGKTVNDYTRAAGTNETIVGKGSAYGHLTTYFIAGGGCSKVQSSLRPQFPYLLSEGLLVQLFFSIYSIVPRLYNEAFLSAGTLLGLEEPAVGGDTFHLQGDHQIEGETDDGTIQGSRSLLHFDL